MIDVERKPLRIAQVMLADHAARAALALDDQHVVWSDAGGEADAQDGGQKLGRIGKYSRHNSTFFPRPGEVMGAKATDVCAGASTEFFVIITRGGGIRGTKFINS